MSARVEPVGWGWYCADCGEGGSEDALEQSEAEQHAEDHNRQQHEGADHDD